MKVAKWGNSLAVRIPAPLALELGLKGGDEVELVRNPEGVLEVSREIHLEAIDRMHGPAGRSQRERTFEELRWLSERLIDRQLRANQLRALPAVVALYVFV